MIPSEKIDQRLNSYEDWRGDLHKLINAGLESKKNGAISFSEGDKLDEPNLKDLIKEAVSLNV